MSEFYFTKNNIDALLLQLGKEFKRIGGRKVHAEVTIIGGAAIVSKYGFRPSTTYIDALINAPTSMKDAINNVGDNNNLPNGWINPDFMKTCSYTEKIREYSVYYKTFCNVLEVRMLPPAYDVAMKLQSFRSYKYDISDIIGIIKTGNVKRDEIEEAVGNLYGGFDNLVRSKDAVNLLDCIYSTDDLDELYRSTRGNESENRIVLKELSDNEPDIFKKYGVDAILEMAKRKNKKI